jgi:hypothetical protein
MVNEFTGDSEIGAGRDACRLPKENLNAHPQASFSSSANSAFVPTAPRCSNSGIVLIPLGHDIDTSISC